MKKVSMIAAILHLAGLVCTVQASAWEVEYNASTGLLPTESSPAWQLDTYNGVTPTISDGALCMQSLATNRYTYYRREILAIDAGVPVTMEARMRVEGTSTGAPVLSIKAKGLYNSLNIYSNHLAAFENSSSSWVTFSGDFATFRTIRIAYDGSNQMYAWVDGQLALSWQSFGAAMSGSGVMFGATGSSGAFDSYWQSVAYSKEFLPIPEPSSLAALLGLSLLAAGGLLGKRKR